MGTWIMRIGTVLVCVAAFSAGCATTTATSFKDPSFQDKKYSKILVFANIENFEWRQSLEETLATEIVKNGGGCAISRNPAAYQHQDL